MDPNAAAAYPPQAAAYPPQAYPPQAGAYPPQAGQPQAVNYAQQVQPIFDPNTGQWYYPVPTYAEEGTTTGTEGVTTDTEGQQHYTGLANPMTAEQQSEAIRLQAAPDASIPAVYHQYSDMEYAFGVDQQHNAMYGPPPDTVPPGPEVQTLFERQQDPNQPNLIGSYRRSLEYYGQQQTPSDPEPSDYDKMQAQAEYLMYLEQTLAEQGYDFDTWVTEMQGMNPANPNWWWPFDEQGNYREVEQQLMTETVTQQDSNLDWDQLQLQQQDLTESDATFGETEVEGTSSASLGPDDIDYRGDYEMPPLKRLMGTGAFKFLETRVLAAFIKDTEDERMEKIKERLGFMKRVSAPKKSDIDVLLESNNEFDEAESKENLGEMKLIQEYPDVQWALKNARSFLRKAGCTSPVQSLTAFRVPDKDRDERLKVFLNDKVGKKHRGGIPEAPEIDAPMKRQAERAIWRYIIDNSKPKYPLPRFILPRYRFLKKVEKELIGPGSYECDYYEKMRWKKLRANPSSWRSCSKRFPPEKIANPTTATDAYGNWEEACDHYRHPNVKVTMFESTPCNFRHKNFYVGCALSPAEYNISPTEESLKQVKSLRGIYTSGSGDADYCRIRKDGKYDTYESRLGPGSYNIRQPLAKELNNNYTRFKGIFPKAPRNKMFGFRAAFDNPLWPIDKGYPGPATYDPYEGEEWTEPCWAPFNVAVKGRKLNDLDSSNKLMAPDFYYYRDPSIPEKKDILGDGFQSNFNSETPQITPESRFVFQKERNKAANWKWDQAKMFRKKNLYKKCQNDEFEGIKPAGEAKRTPSIEKGPCIE